MIIQGLFSLNSLAVSLLLLKWYFEAVFLNPKLAMCRNTNKSN